MPYTAHLSSLYGLSSPATNALADLLGAHFVSHETLDRPTLERLVAEAEAVA